MKQCITVRNLNLKLQKKTIIKFYHKSNFRGLGYRHPKCDAEKCVEEESENLEYEEQIKKNESTAGAILCLKTASP